MEYFSQLANSTYFFLYYQWVQRLINNLKAILGLSIGYRERSLSANPLSTSAHFIL
jgi:hypothetical protein